MRPEARLSIRKQANEKKKRKKTCRPGDVAAAAGASAGLIEFLDALRGGGFSTRMARAGVAGAIADAFNDIVVANRRMVKELEQSRARLVESERARGLALAAGNMGSWDYRRAQDRWTCDEGLSRIFGIDPPAPNSGPVDIERYFDDADWAMLQSFIASATPERNMFQAEMRVRRASGDTRACLVSAAASFDAQAVLVRLDGVMIDITDRKEAENKQAKLAWEVDHRARNLLAMVQSIVRLTRSKDAADYSDAIEGRIRALAHAQDILSQSRWQGVDIARLVAEEVAPHRLQPGRIAISGPSVALPPDKAQAIALSLHELTTNAAKHGALSAAAGSVAIEWHLKAGVITLEWKELGGPTVEPPQSEGLGTKIIHACIKGHGGGSVALDWQPQGLRCTIAIPCSGKKKRDKAANAAKNRSPARGPQRVFLIEDEALLSLLMRNLLTEMGLAIDESGGGGTKAPAKRMPLLSTPGPHEEFSYPLALDDLPFVFMAGRGRRLAGASVLNKPLSRKIIERALGSTLARARQDEPLRA